MDSLMRLRSRPRFVKPGKKKRKGGPVKSLKRLKDLRNRVSHPFYSSEAWLRLRYRVLVKNGRKCQACGVDGLETRFHVDHIKPRSRFPALALEEANLQVLCEACNLGKGAWDMTDWRPKASGP